MWNGKEKNKYDSIAKFDLKTIKCEKTQIKKAL